MKKIISLLFIFCYSSSILLNMDDFYNIIHFNGDGTFFTCLIMVIIFVLYILHNEGDIKYDNR
jgi:hypothetical protein